MVEFRMPTLGADMEAGTLVEWLVKPGDEVKRGQVVAVVETQKGAIEIEIWENGTVDRLVVETGRKVPVGEVLALLRAPGEAVAAAPVAQARRIEPTPRPEAAPPAPPRAAPAPGAPARARISPSARQLAFQVVEERILEHDDRVRVQQRGPEHPPRVLERGGRHDADARDVRVPPLEAVRMLRGKLPPGTGCHADHERDAELAARHMADGGGVIDDLVEREQAEVDGHHFDDRQHAVQCRADSRADERRLGQRRVAYALLAEFRQQSLAHGVAAAVAPDVLAHEEHARVAGERLPQCLAQRFPVGRADPGGRLAHAALPV